MEEIKQMANYKTLEELQRMHSAAEELTAREIARGISGEHEITIAGYTNADVKLSWGAVEPIFNERVTEAMRKVELAADAFALSYKELLKEYEAAIAEMEKYTALLNPIVNGTDQRRAESIGSITTPESISKIIDDMRARHSLKRTDLPSYCSPTY